jgi:hypothetical protein
MGPRTGLDDMEKRKFLPLPGLELRPLDYPTRSQSLYRLRYPGSFNNIKMCLKKTGFEGGYWIQLAQDNDQFSAVENRAKNFRVS